MKEIGNHIARLIGRAAAGLKDLATGRSLSAGALRTLALVVVITLASFLCVDIFYKVVQLAATGGEASTRIKPAVFAPQGLRPAVENYDVIVQRNLFMTTLTALADKGGGLTPSEEYTAFDLKGTIAVDETTGYAVVEEKGKGKQKLYRLGEMIGSAKLIRVTRQEAVLASGGREMVMKIKDAAEGALAGRGPGLPGSGISVSRQDVTQSLGDLKSIMSQAVVRPFMSEGVQQGYIVSNIAPGSLYERLGLRNGDIVQEVNGKVLDSADDVLQLVNVMQSGGSIAVNLIRNGRSESINYSFH